LLGLDTAQAGLAEAVDQCREDADKAEGDENLDERRATLPNGRHLSHQRRQPKLLGCGRIPLDDDFELLQAEIGVGVARVQRTRNKPSVSSPVLPSARRAFDRSLGKRDGVHPSSACDLEPLRVQQRLGVATAVMLSSSNATTTSMSVNPRSVITAPEYAPRCRR